MTLSARNKRCVQGVSSSASMIHERNVVSSTLIKLMHSSWCLFTCPLAHNPGAQAEDKSHRTGRVSWTVQTTPLAGRTKHAECDVAVDLETHLTGMNLKLRTSTAGQKPSSTRNAVGSSSRTRFTVRGHESPWASPIARKYAAHPQSAPSPPDAALSCETLGRLSRPTSLGTHTRSARAMEGFGSSASAAAAVSDHIERATKSERWQVCSKSESTRTGRVRDAPVVVTEPQMNESASTLEATNHALPRLKLDTTHASRKLYLAENRCPLSGCCT